MKKSVYAICATVLLLIWPLLIGYAFSESLVPEGLLIEETFKPGSDREVGKIGLVQGKVIIIHSGVFRGYLAKKGLPLFKGDTIITREKGRIQFEFDDGSILTLASRTKLVISQSIYEPSGKRRSSFISMSAGKVRFWVKKLVGFKNSEFEVKTKTAIVGVRGSDFIIKATPVLTEVTTLKNTVLEVVGIADVTKPTLLKDFQRITVSIDKVPTEAANVPSEETEQILREMMITVQRDEIPKIREDKAERTETYEPAAQTDIDPEEEDMELPEDFSEQDIDTQQPDPDEDPDKFKPDAAEVFEDIELPEPPSDGLKIKG